jgi:hypothetical protein
MIGLTLAGCATSRRLGRPTEPASASATAAEVARGCDDLVDRLGYAKKSVAGRAAVTTVVAPLFVGIGLLGTAVGRDPRGLALAVKGPTELVKWTAQAGKENTEQFARIRQACEEGGGPDTASTAKAVRGLADVRRTERSTGDAARLYRDALALLDRAGAGASDDAAATALALANLLESRNAADPEVGPLYDRALPTFQRDADVSPYQLQALLVRYAAWHRAGGRTGDAEAMQARADAVLPVIEARVTAERIPPRATSVTGIAVAESCAQPGITTLDALNAEAATRDGSARIRAAACHADGRLSAVHLDAPTGESIVIALDDEDTEVAERIRRALFASES